MTTLTASLLETSWIWHPQWIDHSEDSAGGFVHFRKSFSLQHVPDAPVQLLLTADTKYRLYVNGHLVHTGPVNGDEHIWFYDEVDIAPFLQQGVNNVGLHVLRLYHGTPYGTSFPRMPFPGLFVRAAGHENLQLDSDSTWLTAIDPSRKLRIDQKEDDFLHVYEDATTGFADILDWVGARVLPLSKSHGIGPPWMLSPRMIPLPQFTSARLKAVHNVQSCLPQESWERILVGSVQDREGDGKLRLPAGSSHHVELEADHHLTAYLRFRFERPQQAGSSLRITYSECYEDTPEFVPYIRRKGDRCDRTKQLLGPEDRYKFAGQAAADSAATLLYTANPTSEEIFSPFHFRTFRFLALDIQVCDGSDLVMAGIDVDMAHYPLEVVGQVDTPDPVYDALWTVSVRTLTNCMHDCYEDCPFYEQLQYAMDVRSSCLFTYFVSGDDRMARQAILQLQSSYRADLGLTASRSPSSQLQIIPHFSLFWILIVVDHFEHFGDVAFSRQLLAVCDGILEAFAGRINSELGLVSSRTPFWDFVDWTDEWRPMGIPPAAEKTGYQTFTNMLYAHTMQKLAKILPALGRQGIADELSTRADAVVTAVREHCRTGEVFTDGLAAVADHSRDFSQHNQIWSVLCGASTGDAARDLLRTCLPVLQRPGTWLQTRVETPRGVAFTEPSQAMSLYVFRALSAVGGTLYDDAFHAMWEPWRDQLSQNLTTWCEDDVGRRSDCHAWSCAPLYELMAEVAGVQPAEPGWGSVAFRPRTRLFGRFTATVPLAGKLAPGKAVVDWRSIEGSAGVSVSLSLETKAVTDGVPIHVTFPDGCRETHFGLGVSLTFE
ncbi:Six-hairpin glycosidase-like protein [Thelonectria olida]|uniref:Six-hairpin glycosidase-like protein n=1 Tax=Thelonectria olida TaxID=1576542 RepID=A0A9P8VYR0_9HYPO|nr:Six-hairpin glycosidase-like protein [Thelonectria olida]